MKKPLPPTYFNLFVLLLIAVHFFLPIISFGWFPWNLAGLVLLAGGGIMNLAADKEFKRFNTTVKPFEYSSALITSGVFRLSRNPMYVGMVLFLLGESVILGTASPFLITILFPSLMYFVFIKKEEKMLLEKFNDEYLNYSKEVRRWL